MMYECRFHRIECDLFQIPEVQIVFFTCDRHFLREIRVAHQTVVRAEKDPEIVAVENREGMFLK